MTQTNNIIMPKIIPHLWFDREAKEAAQLYVSIFDNSRLLDTAVIEDTPSGDTETVYFELAGQKFIAISAGPFFSFNPSISLMVACSTKAEVNAKWEALSHGGEELMPLGEYPFSKWYGWIQDKYGLSWQLMLVEGGSPSQKITPNLLFSDGSCGKAEEAVQYYTKLFENSDIGITSRYQPGEAQSANARVNYLSFSLSGMNFSAMDNAFDVDYSFNEAFSLMINCRDQSEIDYYWSKLSAVPEAEQCGWLKDPYGVSWQVVPQELNDVMQKGSKEEIKRVTQAFLKMKKLDLSLWKKLAKEACRHLIRNAPDYFHEGGFRRYGRYGNILDKRTYV